MAGRRREAGHVVVFALLVAMLLAIASIILSALLVTMHKSTRRELVGLRLKALSDAALAATMAEIASGSFHGITDDLGEGSIASEVQQLDAYTLEITATGRFRDRERRVKATVDISGPVPRLVSWRMIRRSEPADNGD